MKYYKVIFTISLPGGADLLQDARDVLAALAGEAGLESFEETEQGLTGYAQQTLFDQPLLEQLTADFPLPGCAVTFSVAEAEDRDWNEAWEQAGFDPICLPLPTERGGTIVVHDTRHPVPATGQPITDIVIEARMASFVRSVAPERGQYGALAAQMPPQPGRRLQVAALRKQMEKIRVVV